jgi:Ca2+-binding EF-hand superfamily protein
MQRTALIVFGLAIAAAALPLQAQQAAGDRPARHAKVDANGDGVIDRNEAAAHPKLAERFDQLDRNRDGRIGPEERPQRGGRGGPGGGMDALDTNGDGAIDRSEAGKAPKLAERFDQLDRNRDGRIGPEERPQRGGQGGRGGKGDRMAALDTNGDGAIDRNEAAKVPRMAEHFDRLDANKDGRISAEERPQRGGRHGGRHGGKGGGMTQLDRNGDGRFSREELAGRDRVLQQFDTIDRNRDGQLTREEMQAHRQARQAEGRTRRTP